VGNIRIVPAGFSPLANQFSEHGVSGMPSWLQAPLRHGMCFEGDSDLYAAGIFLCPAAGVKSTGQRHFTSQVSNRPRYKLCPTNNNWEQRIMKSLLYWLGRLRKDKRGEVFVEYILLLTIVGIGVIVGLAVLKDSLLNELQELSDAILAITP
jgi:Flp pilus assembly pilin Flp